MLNTRFAAAFVPNPFAYTTPFNVIGPPSFAAAPPLSRSRSYGPNPFDADTGVNALRYVAPAVGPTDVDDPPTVVDVVLDGVVVDPLDVVVVDEPDAGGPVVAGGCAAFGPVRRADAQSAWSFEVLSM
jgi:hypothetical protein